MKKKATTRQAKAASRQSTLDFPTSSEADLVAESTAAETSTKSGAKNRRKRTADFADDADKPNKAQCDSSVPVSSAPTERNKIAQGKKRSAAALGQHPSITESPEGATHSDPLPQGWQWSTVEELCDVVRGGSPRPAGDPRYFGGDIPWITVGPITADKTPYLRSVPQTITALGKERSRFVEPGTLLLTNSGATLGVPKITLIGGGINDGVAALLNVPESLKWYLLYFLQTQTTRLRTVNQGAAQPNLNTSIIKSISVPVAPAAEQIRIVAEIEKQFTRLDAGVAALKRVQANLKRYRAAVLKAACEGKLVPTEAELARPEGRTYETGEQLLQRILTQRRQNWLGRGQYKEPADLDNTKIFEVPVDWTWATLDSIAEVKGGITKDQNRNHTTAVRSVPYLRVANVQRGYIDLTEVKEIVTTEDEIQELALKPGDILFNEGGDRDKLGRGWIWNGELPECIHQNHVFRARLHVAALNPKLVSWYANTFGQKFFSTRGSTQPISLQSA